MCLTLWRQPNHGAEEYSHPSCSQGDILDDIEIDMICRSAAAAARFTEIERHIVRCSDVLYFWDLSAMRGLQRCLSLYAIEYKYMCDFSDLRWLNQERMCAERRVPMREISGLIWLALSVSVRLVWLLFWLSGCLAGATFRFSRQRRESSANKP